MRRCLSHPRTISAKRTSANGSSRPKCLLVRRSAATLLLSLLARNKTAQFISLVLIVLCSAAAWPVLYYGQHGYNHLFPQLDTESQQWLDVHMHRAEQFIYAFYATAILGIAALVSCRK